MSVFIELRRNVRLQRWKVVGELATLEKRPELQLLLAKVREHGLLRPEVVDALLPGLGSGGARGLGDHLRRLGLIDREGALTRHGLDAAKSGLVPVLESGLYELVLAHDPVFGSRIFNVVRLEAGAAAGRAQTTKELASLPVDEPFGSWASDEEWVLRRLVAPAGEAAKGAFIDERQVQLSLRIEPGHPGSSEWWLSGRYGSAEGERAIPPRKEAGPAVDGWALFESWFGVSSSRDRWDAQRRALRVPFDLERLDEDARARFETTLSLREVEVPGCGRFAECTIVRMPLAPLDAVEAQKWANWRLLDEAAQESTGYLSRSDLHHRLYDLVAETPLEEHEPALPSHEELVRSAAGNASLTWRLQAAVDLSPQTVPDVWLAPVPVKRPPRAKRGATTAALTILPDERRSMAELVRALNLVEAKKCLIYDKHIDRRSLPVLRALVEAIRAGSLQRRVGIVTRVADDAEGKALRQELRQLVGSEPLDIRSLAHGPLLHGRYILFGDGRARVETLQATHSLVHARPERGVRFESIGVETPLIWNDVTFTLQPEPPAVLRFAWEKLS